ncbi:unnamed protein product [Symbiodinium natans]|uniref:Uncharacterized protein n=1 Tax=Symbiodinium natans TaxID=878477 RepID=A0A812N639_9DINO|nr:unnamed protein product [Symbiodinium natans]
MASKEAVSDSSAVEATHADMSSSLHVGTIFQEGLPKQTLSSRGQKQVETLLDHFCAERSDYKDLCVEYVKWAWHGTQRGRHDMPAADEPGLESVLGAVSDRNGAPHDFTVPSAVERLAQRRTTAMSFAGKGFSAAVRQANVLALLVHSSSWQLILLLTGACKRWTRRRRKARATRLRELLGNTSPKASAIPPTGMVLQQKPQLRSPAAPRESLGHCHEAAVPGRISETQAKQQEGSKRPEKSMLAEKGNFPGIFSGCFSNWSQQSRKQKWARVCSNMPAAAKKARQLPG